MKAEQVDQALIQKFITEDERLVFWHDPNAEFTDHIEQGIASELRDVQILKLADLGGLEAKLRLEREDPTGKYLVYSVGERPKADADWLLDVRLYSAEFHADVASIWLQEFELADLGLRDHLKARSAFLGNQERRKKLKALITPDVDETGLDVAMIGVLVGSLFVAPFAILRALCHGHVEGERYELAEPPEVMATLEKMGLSPTFWEMMGREFGYAPENPSIAGLLRQVLVSELFHTIGDAKIASLAHFVLLEAGQRNSVVFLSQWRDSSGKASSYDAVAAAVGAELKIKDAISGLTLEDLKSVDTFLDIERRIVSDLKNRVLESRESVDVDEIASIASDRKAGYWLNGPGSEGREREALANAYSAIVSAARLFKMQAEHLQALSFESPDTLLAAYRSQLYQFDLMYRHFCADARAVEGRGWDLLKNLSSEIENTYDQGFLVPLGVEWSRLLDAGFLDTWALDDLPPQHEFYARNIQPHLAGAERKRAYVIISDAFRYEAATELVESINSRYRMKAKLGAMLGVLPSYTALGMASLLPHDSIAYNDKGEVLIDGKSVAGTDLRHKQLATVEGMACQASDLRVRKGADAREFTRDKRVVYIYHNVIDARGDSAPTEGETFDAVVDCIRELEELVHFCVNKLNAAKVWVTADHGFLFQQDAPGETDKSKLTYKPDQAVKMKKRYVIGRDLGGTPEAHHGSTQVTAFAEGGMEFWVPRGANKFHFTGGARFVHGGAMPQEVVIPVVTVTQLRDRKAQASRSQKVSVQVLGANHKITTPKYRFEFIQTEAVGERRAPVTVRAAVYEGDQPVTSVETVTFESDSDSIDQRKKSIRLELRTGAFDKSTQYRLVLRDVENEAEVLAVPVTIDRSFDDDF